METAKNFLFNKAPKKITLFGDKTKNLESATHIIEFPGRSIEVSRTTEGNYWAHISVNHEWAYEDLEGRYAMFGNIVNSRIDTCDGITEIPNHEQVQHLAILIKPSRKHERLTQQAG